MGFRVDIRPYKVQVTKTVEVEDDFDVRGSLPEFFWEHQWSAEEAFDIDTMLERLKALPPDTESFEITDREQELVQKAVRATKGARPPYIAFLRRLAFTQERSE